MTEQKKSFDFIVPPPIRVGGTINIYWPSKHSAQTHGSLCTSLIRLGSSSTFRAQKVAFVY